VGGFVPRESVKPNIRKITDYTDGLAKYRLLDERRNLIVAASRQPPLLRLADKKLDILGQVVSERRGNWERDMDESGVGAITLQWSDWLADLCMHKTRIQEDLHLIVDLNPNNRTWRTRMGYKVTDLRAIKNKDGTRGVELEFISLREHAKHITLRSTPASTPEFQPLKAWVWVQNLRSNLAFTTFLNLARNFWPVLSVPTSIFNPVHWLTTKVGNLSPLHWPIQVQFVNPVLDQSRVLPLASKWQSLHAVAGPLMDDAGVCLLDYLWLKGEDTTSPHPELAALIGEELAMPSRSCVVLAFEDRSGVTGPTGTAADGALNLVGAVLDDTITELIMPIDNDGDGKVDPFFRKLLGVAPERPSLVWRDCEYSGIISSEHHIKKPGAQTVSTGGHSPTWLNQVQTMVIRWAISQLSEVIMYAAPGGLAAFQGAVSAIGAPGLENVYQNQFDDLWLSYQVFSSPSIGLWLNEYAFIEDHEQGNGYAYVVSAALTIRQGLHKNKEKVTFKVAARDGSPWCYGYDYTIADRGLFEIDGIYHAEQIRKGRWSYDETTPIHLDLTIGKDGGNDDPFDAGMRALADGWNAIGSLIGGAAVAA
jgi:hypothetical protein